MMTGEEIQDKIKSKRNKKACKILTVFFANFFRTLKTTAVPVYTRCLDRDRAEAGRLARALLASAGLFSLFSAALWLLVAPYLVKLLAPGFSGELYLFTVDLHPFIFLVIFRLKKRGIALSISNSHIRDHVTEG